jgi:ABC-2 type transport system ATP-binding protein
MADPIVHCDGLAKRYGDRTVLAGLTVSLARGEVFGLVGANGGSKTTTLRLLAGLLEPDGGTCRVFGVAPARARRRIGYMPQALSLYGELTVLENLRARADLFEVPRPAAAAQAIVERFGLQDHARTRFGRLSAGWARRTQLGATLVNTPDLALLDEPTVGLDAAARQLVWAQILELAADDATVVVSTHDLAEAERFSRLAFLAEGRVLVTGTPAEIIAGAGVRTVLITGAVAGDAAREAPLLDGVVAAYPSGGALRVVMRKDAAGDAALQIVRRYGLRPVAVEANLDDAAQRLLRTTAHRA